MRIVVCVKEVLDPAAVNNYALALFRGGDGRQRLRRSVLAHLRHNGPLLDVLRLRSDGPCENPNSSSLPRRPDCRRAVDSLRFFLGVMGEISRIPAVGH